MDPPEMIMVDCKTFEELVQALGELVDYSRWVIARQDVEASHKLRPIVKRMIYERILRSDYSQLDHRRSYLVHS